MAIASSRTHQLLCPDVLNDGIESMTAANQDSLRLLLHAVPAPTGSPGLAVVVQSSLVAIHTFAAHLQHPNFSFNAVTKEFESLSRAFAYARPSPIHRMRYRDFPAWALLATTSSFAIPDDIHLAIGAELAMALHSSRRFSRSLAMTLLAKLRDDRQKTSATSCATITRTITNARQLFSADADIVPTSRMSSFSDAVIQHFHADIFYAQERSHQAIPDYRAQSSLQVKDTAGALKAAALSGDRVALFTIIAVLTNLPEQTALQIPLLDHVADEWILALDPARGCIVVEMDLLSKGRARLAIDTDIGATEMISDVYLMPLPCFAADLLRARAAEDPQSTTLGTLLQTSDLKPTRRLSDKSSGLPATFARLRNGMGSFAVTAGLARYHASLLTLDPKLVPSAKFYYSVAMREELWQAANAFYTALDWGDPVPFIPGTASGSRITPTCQTIADWHTWMMAELQKVRPARRYSFESLITFHNLYAKYCGSTMSWLLALRERQALPTMWDHRHRPGLTIQIFDKRTGQYPRPRPVPICHYAARIVDQWHQHCRELERRLEKLGLPPSHPTRISLTQKEKSGHSDIWIFNCRSGAKTLSTQDLVEWWPETLGLRGNFGRHYWQQQLRQMGISDTDIDRFVRHHVAGMDQETSTGDRSVASWARRVVDAIDGHLLDLALAPIPGLGRKEFDK